MTDWRPIGPKRGGYNSSCPVRISVTGIRDHTILMLEARIVERLGNPTDVVPMLNGNPSLLGLRAADSPVRGESLRLTRSSHSARRQHAVASSVSLKGTLELMGKALQSMDDVPHHWDGDVLVIDLSGLPDAQGGT